MRELRFSETKMDIESLNKNELMRIKLWIARSGDNSHGLPIKEETLDKSKKSLIGKPVVAKFNKFFQDLEGHEIDEVPVGVILKEDDIFFEQDEIGTRWLCAYATIWSRYAKDVAFVLNRDKVKNVSMEVLTNINDNDEIEDMYFVGVTLIGVEPSIPKARAEVMEFSALSNKINELYFSKKTRKLKQFEHSKPLSTGSQSDELVVDKSKNHDKELGLRTEHFEKGGTILEDEKDFEKKEDETVEVKAEEVEVKAESEVDMSSNANVDPNASADTLNDEKEQNEKKSEEYKEEQMENDVIAKFMRDMKMFEDGEEVDMEKLPEKFEAIVKKYADMESEFAKMKEEHTVYMEEIEGLRKFKCDFETVQMAQEIEKTMSMVSDVMPKDKAEELKMEAQNYSLENIHIWSNQVKAMALDFSIVNKKDGITRMGLVNEEKKLTGTIWDKL